MPILFTYGSLMQGKSNHPYLLALGAKFMEKNAIQAELLPTKYPFPAIREGLGLAIAPGELYQVSDDALDHLDRFEGHPLFYQRRNAVTTDGIPVVAYYGTGVLGMEPYPQE